jgi:branched-chain amino acid transport system substrate-binding protein
MTQDTFKNDHAPVQANVGRRRLVQAVGAVGALTAAGAPVISQAQSKEAMRVGLITVKTGPLASGGIDMERALVMYLKERNNTLAGRKIDLIVADSGGVPATARTKTQELVEKNKVHMLIGPLAAFEALAIDDYIAQQKIPTLSVAAAEDMTQRKANPWFVRATSTSSQCAHPMADYCAKTLKWKRMVLIADDIAYGHEMTAGFQRVFENLGGKIIQKLFSPLTVPDYGTYLAQLKTNADAVFLGFAGSNGFRFLRQFNEYGLRGKIQVVGGMTALDESVLRNMGDEALGILTSCWYSAEANNPLNRKFAPAFRKEFKYDPGFYAAATYVNGAMLEQALTNINGKFEDKAALMKALRAINVQTVRGPVSFDNYGNVVGDVYIRRVERLDGRLVNTVQYTYPNVSQFWDMKPEEFLKNPVYSRDYPPARNLES